MPNDWPSSEPTTSSDRQRGAVSNARELTTLGHGGAKIGGRRAASAAFDAIEGATWERTGHRSDGAEFTVESFARYLLHDPEHHPWHVRTN